jgi:hypothetical protein
MQTFIGTRRVVWHEKTLLAWQKRLCHSSLSHLNGINTCWGGASWQRRTHQTPWLFITLGVRCHVLQRSHLWISTWGPDILTSVLRDFPHSLPGPFKIGHDCYLPIHRSEYPDIQRYVRRITKWVSSALTKVKRQSCSCALTEHRVVKAYWGVEV